MARATNAARRARILGAVVRVVQTAGVAIESNRRHGNETGTRDALHVFYVAGCVANTDVIADPRAVVAKLRACQRELARLGAEAGGARGAR